MRTHLKLNDRLLKEALAVTGLESREELIELALRELVRRRRKKDLGELAGRIGLREDFDHKALRTLARETR